MADGNARYAGQTGATPGDQERTHVGVIGLFDDPEQILVAARAVRDAGWSRWDCHTPYPVHGLDEAMGVKRSRLPLYALSAGAVAAAAFFYMQWWMNGVDYPLNVGGKPLFSWPSFIPITFEMFVLFTALTTTVLATRFCGLWQWHSPLHDSGVMPEVTGHRFGVALSADDPCYDEATARALLESAGCADIRPLFQDPDDGKTL
jgi:hypothetical protein